MRKVMLVLSSVATGICAYAGAIHVMNGQWAWAALMLVFFGLNLDSVLRNLRS